MKISRRFTTPDQDVFDSVEWTTRSSRISNADGSLVFEMTDAEIPSSWSQLATDIVVSKYFRKAGVPQFDGSGQAIEDEQGNPNHVFFIQLKFVLDFRHDHVHTRLYDHWLLDWLLPW